MSADWGSTLSYGATQDTSNMFMSQPGYDNSSFSSTRTDTKNATDNREPIVCMTIDQVYNRFDKCPEASSVTSTLALPSYIRPTVCILCIVLSYDPDTSIATVYDYIGSGSLYVHDATLGDLQNEWIYLFGDINRETDGGQTASMYPMFVRKAISSDIPDCTISDTITLHMLDCMHSLMWLKHGPLARREPQKRQEPQKSVFNNLPMSSPVAKSVQKTSGLKDDIKNFISNRGSARFDDITRNFNTAANTDTIKNALTNLESEGHIYLADSSYYAMDE